MLKLYIYRSGFAKSLRKTWISKSACKWNLLLSQRNTVFVKAHENSEFFVCLAVFGPPKDLPYDCLTFKESRALLVLWSKIQNSSMRKSNMPVLTRARQLQPFSWIMHRISHGDSTVIIVYLLLYYPRINISPPKKGHTFAVLHDAAVRVRVRYLQIALPLTTRLVPTSLAWAAMHSASPLTTSSCHQYHYETPPSMFCSCSWYHQLSHQGPFQRVMSPCCPAYKAGPDSVQLPWRQLARCAWGWTTFVAQTSALAQSPPTPRQAETWQILCCAMHGTAVGGNSSRYSLRSWLEVEWCPYRQQAQLPVSIQKTIYVTLQLIRM